MKKRLAHFFIALFICTSFLSAQTDDDVVEAIQKEANENSQLEQLAYELMDVIGPRLVGTPQMENAYKWAVETYKKWGHGKSNCLTHNFRFFGFRQMVA